MATQDRRQQLCSGAPCPTPTLWSLTPTCRGVICGAGPDLAGAWPWPTLADRRSVCRYVQHYGLGEACDDIVSVLKRVAVKLGKTQKVKVLTGTGDVNVIQPNYPAAARDFLRTFRSGLLGPVMLDRDTLQSHPSAGAQGHRPAETDP